MCESGELRSSLWDGANTLRGSAVDRTDWKGYILPLLFFKRISDVWDEETAEAQEIYGEADPSLFPEIHRFVVPEGCHWNDVRETATNVGAALHRAMQEIERANPDTLFRVFGTADWGNKEKFSDELLKDLIEGFSDIGLGNKAVSTDVLGDAYEYLIGKFADVTRRNKAGEFYTPRSVVRMMVEILDPQEGESIYDPTCGTGGMLLGAIEHVMRKGGEAEGVLNDRDNIIVMVDEAHRTQEGDLGRKMREALPNAFLFGLTGTPINRANRNTFYAFGSEIDENGYMSRYGLNDSIRNGATKELHFEPRLVDLHIDQQAIEAAYAELTEGLTDEDRDKLGRAAAKMSILVKAPERISAICADIAQHFQTKVQPNGFGAQVVTFDRESCLLYKQELDKHLPPETSDIVMSVNSGEDEYAAYRRDRDAEEKLLDRFRDPKDPLKIIIVTSKLLTGFDAPILQTMYLDKPLRDHTLLQAICRTNRPYGEQKTHGLIVDYLGIFDDVAQALKFDEKGVQKAVSNIAELAAMLPPAIQKCLEYFAGVDRALTGYEGLIAAQDCLPNDERRDAFASDFSVLSRIWEALSPDPVLTPHEKDYRWLAQVYESLKPSTGTGRLLWHRLGAKTIELIHENVHVDAVRDDLDTLVMDAELLEAVLGNPDPEKKAKEISVKLTGRLRKHTGNPQYKALAERLEDLKNRHQQGLLLSIDFLKELLALAKDVVKMERETPVEEDIDRGKAALTELLENAKNGETPIMVKRVVDDIDEIVRAVRFDGWQATNAGEREVKKALRQTLFKYKLHQDAELFERAYGYIREYY